MPLHVFSLPSPSPGGLVLCKRATGLDGGGGARGGEHRRHVFFFFVIIVADVRVMMMSKTMATSSSSTKDKGRDDVSKDKDDDPTPSCSYTSKQQRKRGDAAGGEGGREDCCASESDSTSSSVVASVFCAVCGKDTTSLKQQIHYGAHACFSCRAFFRRAQNAKRRSHWRCEFDSRCEITEKTRRTCTWCRYQRCLHVGMKESLVLSDSEKKHRFRKVLKKKRHMAKRTAKKAAAAAAEEEGEMEERRALLKIEQSSPKSAEVAAGFHRFVVDIQTGRVKPSLDVAQIAELVRLLKERFHEFIFKQGEFLSLLGTDRRHLQARNTSRYLQCSLCQYFTTNDGREQARLILEETDVSDDLEYTRVTVEDVDEHTLRRLFGEDSVLRKIFVGVLRSACEALERLRDNGDDFSTVHKMILFTHDNSGNSSGGNGNNGGGNNNNQGYQQISHFQKDLELMSNILLVLYHCHVRRPSFQLRCAPADLDRESFFRLVSERSQCEVKRIVVAHEKQIDGDLASVIADRERQVNFLFLVRLDRAELLEEQLRMLNVAGVTKVEKKEEEGGGGREHFVVFDQKVKGAQLMRVRKKRFQRLLEEWKVFLNGGDGENEDLFFLVVLLTVFSEGGGGGGVVGVGGGGGDSSGSGGQADGGISQIRRSYLSVLRAAVSPEKREQLNRCLENLEEVTDLCPTFP